MPDTTPVVVNRPLRANEEWPMVEIGYRFTGDQDGNPVGNFYRKVVPWKDSMPDA
jgi:hypothetical protein